MATTRTTLDLITASLQTLGVYAAAETLTSEDAELSMDTLQDLLAEWSDGGLMVPCMVTEAITLVPGQIPYTVGQSGTPSLNTVRPEQVMEAFISDSGGSTYPVEIIGAKAFLALSLNSTAVGRPDRIFPEYSAPNMTVYVYPAPTDADSLYIVSIKPFLEPTTLPEHLLNTTQIPRNFYNALKWNLALELAAPFQREPSPLLIKRATDTKKTVRNLNMARTIEPVSLGFFQRKGGSLADFMEG